MKLKIKVKELTEGCMPVIIEKGDWIDLKSATAFTANASQADTLKYHMVNGEKLGGRNVIMNTYYIPLGVAMQLPKGFEAIVVSRSSTPNKLGMIIPNGFGVIDGSYNGNNDEWCYIGTPMRNVDIKKGDRICQFRIQLSQKATMWQKIKWFLSSGIKLVKVDNLNIKSRGGFGSTGR